MQPIEIIFVLSLLALQFGIVGVFHSVRDARRKPFKQLAETGNNKAKRTLKLLNKTDTLENTQLLLHSGLTIVLTIVVHNSLIPSLEDAFVSAGVASSTGQLGAYALILPLLSVIVWIWGYHLPRLMLSGRSEEFVMMITPFVNIIIGLASPVTYLLNQMTTRLEAINSQDDEEEAEVFEEEIKTLVDAGSLEGKIETDERAMIYSVFKFRDTIVREVMVPRIDIVAIEENSPIEDILDTIIQAGHSRIPVFHNSIDNIKGFLYAKDLLVLWRRQDNAPINLQELLRPAYFVPEEKQADDLLEEFQNRETHIAIVTDAYGGTAGLVTIEDLIEEIVGEIRDEYDYGEEPPYEAVSETEYICNAGLDLDDLNELLDISLPTDTNDTLGGLIFSQLGKVPEVGDKVRFNGTHMEVLTVNGRRIEKVRVHKQTEVEEEMKVAKLDARAEK